MAQVFLVTGGAAGIGAGIATRLVADGAAVVVADKASAPIEGVRSVVCDVGDEAAVGGLIGGKGKVEGRLDGIVCPCIQTVFRYI